MVGTVSRNRSCPPGVTVLSRAKCRIARSVSVGVWVRNGARDEPAERLGISHFIEHMMFKGTERRDARAIALSLESLGGHLDAFTGREQVCYYARALAEHLPRRDRRAVRPGGPLRASRPPRSSARSRWCARRSPPARTIPRTRSANCSPRSVWGGHALGRPILGTVETIGALDAPTLRELLREPLPRRAAGGLGRRRARSRSRGRARSSAGTRRPQATRCGLDAAPPAFEPLVRTPGA